MPWKRDAGQPVVPGEWDNIKTYYNWQKKVFEAMVEERREAPSFAEVRVQQPESNVAATMRIGPAAVNVYTGADAETVAAIVRALTVC